MTEVAVENIHEYLTKVGHEVRGGKIPLEEYIINKAMVSTIMFIERSNPSFRSAWARIQKISQM